MMENSALTSLECHLLDKLQSVSIESALDLKGEIKIAFSGGVDSKVLLHAMVRLRELGLLSSVSAVHVNHGLMPQADDWAAQCQNDCERYGVKLSVTRLSLSEQERASNIEAAARAGRYEFFKRRLAAGEFLLMAHHRDDQAETLLFRLLRGCGLSGARAIPEKRPLGKGYLFRPLLTLSREEIVDYARQQGLTWIDDPSNESEAFSRNFLRHKVLPIIGSKWPAYAKTLSRFSEIVTEQYQLLEDLAQVDFEQVGNRENQLNINSLAKLSIARKKNLLHYWGNMFGDSPPSVSEIDELLSQIKAAESGSIMVDFAGCFARSFNGELMLTNKTEPDSEFDKAQWDNLQEPVILSNGVKVSATLILPGVLSDNLINNRLRPPRPDEKVWLDCRRGGEKCLPAYRNKSTQLKKIYQELGVPPWRRKWLPVVYYNNDIAAVPGVFVCRNFLSDDNDESPSLILSID
ncbi:tRNA lysidine(34) synthetase TilS [Aliikangiella coralliicola]|uniref:tRNA(Ile)-lysidine synthase n=1 Tax=Aliikangiella coralliicola TaxID=2592383 RepID=A0A545TW21_9GAMM|nr:tRNA lysidine(34) synthetase TilS [Aliikangiella coralliicola]TQV81416.1 tRNA lysidine(34) synthetase TilS [Aliikangiella coralliicola]